MPNRHGPDAPRVNLLDYLLFWELWPVGGWPYSRNINTHLFNALKDWHEETSAFLPTSIFPKSPRRRYEEIESYNFHFNAENTFVQIVTPDGEHFNLHELEILVASEVVDVIHEKKSIFIRNILMRFFVYSRFIYLVFQVVT